MGIFLALLKKQLYVHPPQEINPPKWFLHNTSPQYEIQNRNLHYPHLVLMLKIPN